MPKLEIVTSVFNIPVPKLLTGSLEDFKQFKKDAGSSGYQYTPVRSIHPHMGRQLAAAGLIATLHQSWLERNSIPNRIRGFVLPSLEESMPLLHKVQTALPDNTRPPLVVHPHEQALGGKICRRIINYEHLAQLDIYGPMLHQPTVEVLRAWGVLSQDAGQTAEDMLEAQQERGFSGVALDLHHLKAERMGIRKSQQWCEDFAGSLAMQGALSGPSEVQLSFRPDFGDDSSNLHTAIHNFRLPETSQGRMLTAIRDGLADNPTDPEPSLRMTIEVRPGDVKQYGHAEPAEGNSRLAWQANQLFNS
jgi:hypothetical protein